MYFKQQLCCPIPDTARPCRVGGVRVLLSRTAVGAAFNCDGSMVANGPQVRRGYRLGSLLVVLPRPPFGGARDVAGVLHLSSTHRLGNLANGGAHTAPGSAAPYSLTRQAAPALPISRDLSADPEARRRAEIGSTEATRPPESSAAVAGGELLQGRVPLRRISGEILATREAAGLCPEIAARGRADGATRPRPVTRPADAQPRVCKTLNAQDYATLGARAYFHPATARGGAMRQGGNTNIANALARRAPETGYFSMTATNGRTTEK